MLTGKTVRVRYARDRIIPYYLDADDEQWMLAADQLLTLYREMVGHTRGELEEEIVEMIGDDNNNLVHQGLAKLLEDRCEFETVAGHPPEQLRFAVFRAATEARTRPDEEEGPTAFDRSAVFERVAREMNLTAEQVERNLFADLKSEQKLITFDDTTAERLLQRYNVGLAQAILLRAVRVHVTINDESPQRYRQLLRHIKFHRLLCEIERVAAGSYTFHLDGPLSLFSSTLKYGLQLALFLPAVLLCKSFEVKADLRWGTEKKEKQFVVTTKDKLISHAADSGMYVPVELQMFVESFRKRIAEWELHEEGEIFPLANTFWAPDFRLVHKDSGKVVLLEVLGFWRKSSAEKHLRLLQRHADRPFLLAVSDQLHIEESLTGDLPVGIHRFRHMPLADEVARLAKEAISNGK